MKPLNTRISPTPNGDLHIGHYLTALVNEREAHASGGKFYLCFDDDQEIWDLRQSRDDIARIEIRTIRAFKKLGLKIDTITSNTAMDEEIRRYSQRLGANTFMPMQYAVMANNAPDWVNHDVIMYPYLPHLTMTKVIADFINCINLVIRGEDLLTEFSLYNYFCEVLRLPIPEHKYIGRLKTHDGKEISKSNHFPSLKEMIAAGWTQEDVESLLEDSALIDPRGGFFARNIKADPRLPEGVIV